MTVQELVRKLKLDGRTIIAGSDEEVTALVKNAEKRLEAHILCTPAPSPNEGYYYVELDDE